MPITAEDWYDPVPDLKNLYQGDILDGIPVVYTQSKGKRWVLLRPLPKGPLEQAAAGLPRNFRAFPGGEPPTGWERAEGELVMARASVRRTMILSQSCDLDWRKNIQVAPVYEAEGLDGQTLENLRNNDVGYWFYLPSDGPTMPESYSDLSLKTTVPASYFRRTDYLIRRLTTRAMLELQLLLSDYYGRPFGFNTKDRVVQKALYRCANCFFSGEGPTIVITEIDVGSNFPQCPTCRNALWVKVPREAPSV